MLCPFTKELLPIHYSHGNILHDTNTARREVVAVYFHRQINAHTYIILAITFVQPLAIYPYPRTIQKYGHNTVTGPQKLLKGWMESTSAATPPKTLHILLQMYFCQLQQKISSQREIATNGGFSPNLLVESCSASNSVWKIGITSFI